MASLRTHAIYTNFRQGEITPRLYGRIDWDRYMQSCVTLENFLVQPQGGVTRRPGTRFIAETKDSGVARLIPFRVDDSNIFVLEVGAEYIRFYKNRARVGGGSPYEVSTPYTAPDLFQIHYGAVEDTLMLTHRSHSPYRLSRYADTTWRLATFIPEPFPSIENGYVSTSDVGGTLTPSAVGGNNIQIDSSQAIFQNTDVGRDLLDTSTGAQATIVTVDSTTRVHADIIQNFPSTSAIAAGSWKMAGSPRTTLTPSATGPIGAAVTLTLDTAGFLPGDVGKYVVANGGIAEITSLASTTEATATVFRDFESVDAQVAGSWSIEDKAWSDTQGYPATVGFFEGRMFLASTTKQPESFWASSSFNYYDYGLGSTDDAAINFRASSGDRSAIRWFSPRRQLLMGTASDEFTLTGGSDAAITPTNIRVRPATPHGSGYLMPIRTEHATIFVPANGRSLRELAYAYEVDDYRAADLLEIAEHLTATDTLVDIAYQRPPESTLWAVRSDGTLLACTYLRGQDLVAWSRIVTDGEVESVCTIPSSDGTTEEVWLVVKRTINGAVKRFVEVMDTYNVDTAWDDAPALVTDCARTISFDGGPTNTVSTGLDHLEGETPAIVCDGAVATAVGPVMGGQVSIQVGSGTQFEIGLPFTSTLQTVRPEIPAGGTSQGRPKAWPDIKVRLLNSAGGKINGQIITSPTPPELFSGDKRTTNLGWDEDAWITVVQDQPLPMTVLSIYGVIAVGD